MLHALRQRLRRQDGFTLIELLIVVLIVGILAAIALPAFIGQQEKGQDASAKSDARNMVSHVESCFTENQTYAGCDTTLTEADTGLKFGTGVGQVALTPNGTVGYSIVATSKAAGGGAHKFTITKDATGTARTCLPKGKGACPADGNW